MPSRALGAPPPWGFPFDVVVTLYADAQPAPWYVEEMRYGFYDSELTPEATKRVLAIAAAAYSRWQAGDRVLIRCQAGVNRSGLVTALVLMMHGLTAIEAIELIRRRRSPAVLSNRHFVEWLVTHAHERIVQHRSTSPSSDTQAA